MKWKCSEEKACGYLRTEKVQPLLFHYFAPYLLPTGDSNLGDQIKFPSAGQWNSLLQHIKVLLPQWAQSKLTQIFLYMDTDILMYFLVRGGMDENGEHWGAGKKKILVVRFSKML